MFWHLKKSFWLGRGHCPSLGKPILEIKKRFSREHAINMQAHEPRARHPLSGPYTPEAIFLCLDHPRARFQGNRDHPYSPDPTEIIH